MDEFSMMFGKGKSPSRLEDAITFKKPLQIFKKQEIIFSPEDQTSHVIGRNKSLEIGVSHFESYICDSQIDLSDKKQNFSQNS
jgi:hypothetical protein